jgi:molecular chaperone GrpE (heat shock protein)
MTQSPQNLFQQATKLKQEQERLFQDLLGIMDALDHACSHWQQAEQDHGKTRDNSTVETFSSRALTPNPPRSLVQVWKDFWQTLRGQKNTPSSMSPLEQTSDGFDEMQEVLASAREGVEMIRRSLLDVLRQRQVVPLEATGQPFDPERMYALGRQEDGSAAENTVIQEVVRGYLWQNRVLREAQVMVATKPEQNNETEVKR